jgi:beta-mannosidase
LQAEGIRYGVEHWRRHRDRVAGTLYWQLNDCWPVASWSSLDYFGRWKALHYAARRFYAAVLLSVEDQGTQMGVYVTNDTTQPWQGMVRWSLETLDGQTLERGEEVVFAAAQSCIHVCTRDFADHVADDSLWGFGRQGECAMSPRQLIFVAELWQGNHLVARSLGTFVPNKHLALAEPGLSCTMRQTDDGGLIFDFTSQSLARFVELQLEGADVVFSDNYFDVPANRLVTVTCPLPAGWTEEQARSVLRVRSLYHSFA